MEEAIDLRVLSCSVHSKLAFANESKLTQDTQRPSLKRLPTQPIEAAINPQNAEFASVENCEFYDSLAPSAPTLSLEKMGFEVLDLSRFGELQRIFEETREAAHITVAQGKAIRKHLRGQSFKLSNGKSLRLLYITPAGLILRRAGPNSLDVNKVEEMTAMNGHGGAEMIHGDQDVFGIPLKRILPGLAPRLFRHETPDGKNSRSPFFLVNLWVPLDQATRPLTLMDRRTLNKKQHQVRYTLESNSDLAQMLIDRMFGKNKGPAFLIKFLKPIVKWFAKVDIWLFLHDKKQKLYFTSRMDSNSAYVFDTLGMPHGSFVLPGEKVAEQLYIQFQSACEAVVYRDVEALKRATQGIAFNLPEETTIPLRNAIANMQRLLKEAQVDVNQVLQQDSDWLKRARAAMNRVVRKSIEMRAVAMVT